jgi:tetratricopeptide (TPR) repeat protein
MKRWLTLAGALIILETFVLSGPAHAACKLGKMAELPVTMIGLRPTVIAKINGTDTPFIVDSGAFYSNISPAKAAELKLRLSALPHGLQLEGVGGRAEASVATVKELMLFNVKIPNVEFIVGGSEPGEGVSGLIGQNLLRIADVEYDLANGAIRLIRPDGCRNSALAYWAGSQPYSVMDIDWATAQDPHTTGTALLNGVKIRVVFDTGAATSFLSLRAAERAGIKLDQPDVAVAGFSRGIGSRPVKAWIAPFASFKIGDEEIRNTKLRIGDFGLPIGDMLIGADFFLSHRIYVASSQRKLYFTYNGGPVFNLAKSPPASAPGDEPQQAAEDPNAPTDAAGFSRRGTAFAARRDFDHALEDLTRACELNPDEPEYFYQRGLVRLHKSQPLLALADFDQALKLKPDDVLSHVSRAELRIAGNDNAGADSDLDAAERVASKEADIRFLIGTLYTRSGQFTAAIRQYDLWIPVHNEDERKADALSNRAWARALSGQDLDKSVSDSNAALRLRANTPHFLDRRAFAELKLGNTDKAISDWDTVIAAQPRNAWALYCRGLARQRRGKTSEGNADMAAGTALEPRVAEVARKRGLQP